MGWGICPGMGYWGMGWGICPGMGYWGMGWGICPGMGYWGICSGIGYCGMGYCGMGISCDRAGKARRPEIIKTAPRIVPKNLEAFITFLIALILLFSPVSPGYTGLPGELNINGSPLKRR
jgi:hypothetical protein